MPNIKRANALGITKPGTAIADVPDAPTIGTATGGSGAATVTYTAAATGGTATTFTATSSPGSLTGTGASPITVSGLTNGTAYTFTVTASNSTGTSAASSASNSVTPVSLGDMDPIAMVEVGSAGSSQIEFASIPSTYTHLQIRIMAKLTDSSGVGGYAGVRFNSDASSSNYTFHRLKGDGSDATAYGSGTGTFDWIVNERITSSHSNFATEEHGVLIIDILEYKNTSKYKTVRSLGGYDSNGTGEILLTSGLWLNTTAISNIKILPSTTNFSQYSSFALYGIKGA